MGIYIDTPHTTILFLCAYILKTMNSQLYFKFQFNIKLIQVFLLPFYICNSLLWHLPLCLIHLPTWSNPLYVTNLPSSNLQSPHIDALPPSLWRHTGHTPMQTHSSSCWVWFSHIRLPSSKWGALFTPCSIRSPLLEMPSLLCPPWTPSLIHSASNTLHTILSAWMMSFHLAWPLGTTLW